MKKFYVTLPNNLCDKLLYIKDSLSKEKKYNIDISEIIKEALIPYFNEQIPYFEEINSIKKNHIKCNNTKHNDIISNVLNANKTISEYYVYGYYNSNKIYDKYVNNIYFKYEPIYIGKGIGDRINHFGKIDLNLFEHIENLKKNGWFKFEIIMNNLNETVAYHNEEIFINSFGRINNGTGCLLNKSGGINMIRKTVDGTNYELNIEYNLIKLILKALNSEKRFGNAAKKLNFSERTLYRKINEYSIMKNKESKLWEILTLQK